MSRVRSICRASLLAIAITACGEPARVDGRTLGEALERVHATPRALRRPQVARLGAFGAAGDAAVPSLTTWLRGDPDLRDAAGAALGEIGTAGAQRALADALVDPQLDEHVVDVAVVALAHCAPPERFVDSLRALATQVPQRAARVLLTNAVFAAALDDLTLRRDFIRELTTKIAELDPRSQAAVLRRAAGLEPPLAGSETLLADALARGVAVPETVDALVALGTPAAFAVVAARLGQTVTDRRLVDAVPRFLERGACDGTAAAAALEAAARAADPNLRVAVIDALVALASADRSLVVVASERLDSALDDERASVEAAARSGIVTLVGRGVLDRTATAEAWAARILATTNAGAAARLCSALPELDPSGRTVIAILAGLGADAPPAIAERAEQALTTFATAAARDARATILGRRGIRNAAARAIALVDDPSVDAAALIGVLTTLGTAQPVPAFAAGLLDRLDARVVAATLDASERTTIEAHLLADDSIAVAMRVSAARRLLATTPERARIVLVVGGSRIEVRVLPDAPRRTTPCSELEDSVGALAILPHVGPLQFDRSTARGPRAVVWFGDDGSPSGVDGPAQTVARRPSVRAGLLLPVGTPAPDATAPIPLPIEVLRSLAR